jgi:hypothetical protein
MGLKPQQRLHRVWLEFLVPRWRDYRWPVIGVLGLAAFVLGGLGSHALCHPLWPFLGRGGSPLARQGCAERLPGREDCI